MAVLSSAREYLRVRGRLRGDGLQAPMRCRSPQRAKLLMTKSLRNNVRRDHDCGERHHGRLTTRKLDNEFSD
jgi:hypothetical protein